MNDGWLPTVLDFVTGVGGLILFFIGLILTVYWLFMPMMIISRLDKLLKLVEEEAENMRKTIRAQQQSSSGAVTSQKPITPEAERFYIANGKEAAGPHDREKLAELLQRQIITSRSLVCKEGGTQWQELSNVIKPATTVYKIP